MDATYSETFDVADPWRHKGTERAPDVANNSSNTLIDTSYPCNPVSEEMEPLIIGGYVYGLGKFIC